MRLLPMRRRWLAGLLPLILIVAIGAALRFYRVGALPPGLYRDEGYYGLDALRVLKGDFSLYFAANNGREGLFMYVLAAGIAHFGRTPEALRAASACVGTLTIVAIYFAARNMFSPRIGALSAAILALTFWHLTISRVAFRAVTLPLVLCAMMAFIFAGLRTNVPRLRILYATLAGATFGLAFYTYTSAQLVLPLVALYGLSLWVSFRRKLSTHHDEATRRRRLASAIAFIAAGLVVVAPLLLWLTRHTDLYFGRAGQVSILNPDINGGDLVGALIANIGKTAGMFTFQGDRIWRHNLSLRPVFEGWLAPAFVLGLAVCGWRWRQSRQSRFGADISDSATRIAPQFVLLWLAVMLIPTILAEDAPHFLRAIGALPAACIIAAIGMEAALAWLSRRGILAGLTAFLRRSMSPPAFVATLLLAVSAIDTVNDYFNDYIHRELTRYWLEDHNVQLARLINAHATGDPRALPPTNIWLEDRLANDNPSLEFLAGGRWRTVSADGSGEWLAERNPQLPVLLFVDPNHNWSTLRTTLPAPATLRVIEGPLAQGDRDPSPRRAFIGVRADPAPAGAAQRNEATVRFEEGITLESAAIRGGAQPTNLYTVTLTWRTSTLIREDYAIFVHWLRDGRLQPLTQADSSPAQGYLPMPVWRIGDRIVDEHALSVPGGAQPGDTVRIGIYRRADNRRLAVLDAQGKPTADSVIIPAPQ
ncbi:ArnT family glycosyltransferase [Candidatus Roseilinea sp. NK_OTU-006]|uniref:ArnT family glycosyltransferase n=1 Tax=Candidatus Roseilinea sp. NK_OTU-006 TaxID=2704250 RepID=UPI00145E169E|nr:glycosyltransferase family 39 protein [Candidatus Roseilinea sp. NK_OTU-006]